MSVKHGQYAIRHAGQMTAEERKQDRLRTISQKAGTWAQRKGKAKITLPKISIQEIGDLYMHDRWRKT